VRDQQGNFYLSVWSNGEIIRYNSDFSNQPELISSGHNGPSGLGYNLLENMLGVTNYNSNSISLVPLASSNVNGINNHIHSSFHLHQNYPNPFNPATVISWELAESGSVKLSVYNLVGQRVVVLVDERKNAGHHSVEWEATNMPSGLYLCRLETGGFVRTRKMILIK
jgi:hypothetical protein